VGLGSLFGGFVFGLGMTLAGGCASGTLYRAGQGYLQFWLVLLFMFVGYVLFAFAFPVAETYYFQTLNPFEGQTLYLSLPFSPAVIGVGAVALGTLAYAFVKGRSQLPDDPSGGTGVGTDTRAQAAIGASRTLSAVSLGLRGIADGTVEYGRALASDDRPVTVRLRDSWWDARTAGVAMALVASLWFYVHGHWAITGSEARWAGYLLAGAGFDVASVDYWGVDPVPRRQHLADHRHGDDRVADRRLVRRRVRLRRLPDPEAEAEPGSELRDRRAPDGRRLAARGRLQHREPLLGDRAAVGTLLHRRRGSSSAST